MISDREMVEIFGKENLLYVSPEILHGIRLSNKTRDFILNTGFPNLISYFRFSMDFEPISEDIEIGEAAKHLGQLFTIGCKASSQLVGRMFHLSEIGLEKNASLSDIGKQIKILGLDRVDAIFSSEVKLAWRICLNLENQGEILSIAPINLSPTFVNSSIQQLAASLASFWKSLPQEENLAHEENLALGLKSLKKFENELESIDPKALSTQENVWPVIIEGIIEALEGY